ncbi:MAG: hypothetical protein JWO13_931 [Acidobacteriales bacterium]|nr:hypothetical protein [Terriglobales bacterium]
MSRRMLCIVFALLSLLAVPAWASQARAVRLSYIEGDVQIDRGDTHGFNSAFLNMPVIEGTRLWTRNSGRVEVEFEDGSTARLAPDSIVSFQQLRLENEQRLTLMNIQEGEVYFNVNKHKEDDFSIVVGQQSFTPQKASHFRLGVNKEELSLAVFKGDVELLKRTGERVQLKKNETLTLAYTDPDRYYLAKGITENAQDYWDRERESAINSYASRHQNAGYFGYNDLSQYGSFITINNYGNVWRPYGVGYGWSPFQDGSWVLYPGQGYVWVSSYNWGWTPYHYGSWVNIAGQGWCWRPSPSVRWFPTPNVVNPPANFIPHHPPPGVGVAHFGNAGDIELGRGRIHRDGPASGETLPVGSVASTPATNTTNGASVVSSRPGRGGRDGVADSVLPNASAATPVTVPSTARTPEIDLDRGGRGRTARTPQVTPTATTPAVAPTPVAVTTPSATAVVPVQPTPAAQPTSRGERTFRGENNPPQTDRPARNPSNMDRPARTYTPPPQPAATPARTYTPPSYSPPPMSTPAPAPAPASAPSGGERSSRGSRDPK